MNVLVEDIADSWRVCSHTRSMAVMPFASMIVLRTGSDWAAASPRILAVTYKEESIKLEERCY